ncbi:MAG: acetolactate synthase large subunit [Hyphomonadaceae bacterium]
MGQDQPVSGAEAVIASLAECGVTACFANPGTSEMHLVGALDREPRIRSVLCLFEGVATGAADGFARMEGSPALTLLHLGPGYLNGGANIHNARRAHTPMINLIGDHAVSHRSLDAPLASDIAGLAGPNSRWMKSADRVQDAGRLAAEAYVASFGPPPGPVSLIMPADTAWSRGSSVFRPSHRPRPAQTPDGAIEDAARRIRNGARAAILVNGSALKEEGLRACARLQAAGVRVITDTFVPRQARGAGRFAPERLPYFAEAAIKSLEGLDLLLLAGTRAPVAFFAYPDTPGRLIPEGVSAASLGGPETDSAATVARLAEALGAPPPVAPPASGAPEFDASKLNPHSVGALLARRIPEGTVVCDDGVTASLPVFMAMESAAQHDWLALTGGAIGMGLPLAVGASVARPASKVVCLSGDGAGMYTNQALWTMAREGLDVISIVFVNNAYRILNIEWARTGAGEAGQTAHDMLSLGAPEIDWPQMAKGMGVPGVSVETTEQFDTALAHALEEPGPHLIAVRIP